MAEQKESSVLFSLKELMNLEEDRIKQEEADKDKRVRRNSPRGKRAGIRWSRRQVWHVKPALTAARN